LVSLTFHDDDDISAALLKFPVLGEVNYIAAVQREPSPYGTTVAGARAYFVDNLILSQTSYDLSSGWWYTCTGTHTGSFLCMSLVMPHLLLPCSLGCKPRGLGGATAPPHTVHPVPTLAPPSPSHQPMLHLILSGDCLCHPCLCPIAHPALRLAHPQSPRPCLQQHHVPRHLTPAPADAAEGPASASFYSAIKGVKASQTNPDLAALKALVDRPNLWQVKLRLMNTGREFAKGTLLAPSNAAFGAFATELGVVVGDLGALADDPRLAPTTARMLQHHLLVDFLPSRKFTGDTRSFDKDTNEESYPTVLAS